MPISNQPVPKGKQPVEPISKKSPPTGQEEWEKEFDSKAMDGEFGSGLDVYVLKDFIRQQISTAKAKGIIEGLKFMGDQFMEAYCKHGKQNKEGCEDCGRLTVK